MLDHEGGRGKAGIVAALDVDRPPLIGSFWCPRGPRPSGSVRPRPPPPPPPPLAQVTPKGRGGGRTGRGQEAAGAPLGLGCRTRRASLRPASRDRVLGARHR